MVLWKRSGTCRKWHGFIWFVTSSYLVILNQQMFVVRNTVKHYRGMTALQDRVKKYFLAAFSIFWKEEPGPSAAWTYLVVEAIYICTSQPVLVVLHHKFCMEWEMRRNKKANGMRIKFHIGSLLSSLRSSTLRSIWSEKAGRMKKEWYD